MVALSDINNFIILQSDANITNAVSSDTSALEIVSENITVDSHTRRYENEVHFTNPDNIYYGDFFTVDRSTGEHINLTTAVSNVLGINTKLREITDGYTRGDELTLNNAKVYTDRTVGNIKSNLTDYISSYIDNTISALNANTDIKLNQIALAVSEHTNNLDKHLFTTDRYGGKLNAGYIDNTNLSGIINLVSANILNMIPSIDCGVISKTETIE